MKKVTVFLGFKLTYRDNFAIRSKFVFSLQNFKETLVNQEQINDITLIIIIKSSVADPDPVLLGHLDPDPVFFAW